MVWPEVVRWSAPQVQDPAFDIVSFLRQLRADVPTIVGTYLRGQADILAEHCAPPMVQQLTAIIRAQQAEVCPRQPPRFNDLVALRSGACPVRTLENSSFSADGDTSLTLQVTACSRPCRPVPAWLCSVCTV